MSYWRSSFENKNYYNVSSSIDTYLYSYRRKKHNPSSIGGSQGEFKKTKSPTFYGGLDSCEKDEEWLLGVSKYFKVYDYSSKLKDHFPIYNKKGKVI